MTWLGKTALALQRGSLLPYRLRWLLLRAGGMKVGPGVSIEAGCRFASPRVSIGAGTYINSDLVVDGLAKVAVGANVRIGPGVKLLTGTHAITADPNARASRIPEFRPVTIGDGVWLGAGVVVLPGITVASGCVVAAGAVVTRDTQPDGLYAGVPARRVRELATNH